MTISFEEVFYSVTGPASFIVNSSTLSACCNPRLKLIDPCIPVPVNLGTHKNQNCPTIHRYQSLETTANFGATAQ